ncbi:MAG: hypothetical protein WAM92_13245 [Mycobacterium sp.]
MNFIQRWNRPDRGWPRYLPGGRVRTSTAALIVVFCALFWAYQTFQPAPKPDAPATQVVPPGFVPDPDYTWVPRTNVQEPTTTTPATPTTTPTTTPTETTSPTSPTSPTGTTTPATTATPASPGTTPPTPTPPS